MSDLSTAIAKKQTEKTDQPTVRDLIRAQQPAIEAQLAGTLNSGAFVRAAISEVMKSEPLQQARPASLLGSIMLAAQLKLEIGPALGQFWLTPRKDHGEWVCLPIVGYQGLIELAYRSGRVLDFSTVVVREGDLFDYGANSERGPFYDWKPADKKQDRDWTDVIVHVRIAGGGSVWRTLPKDKILARRPNGWDKGSTSPWKTHEEEMAQKTLVREVAPYLPKSTEFGLAVQVTRQVEEQGGIVQSIEGVHDLVVTSDEGPAAVLDPTIGGDE